MKTELTMLLTIQPYTIWDILNLTWNYCLSLSCIWDKRNYKILITILIMYWISSTHKSSIYYSHHVGDGQWIHWIDVENCHSKVIMAWTDNEDLKGIIFIILLSSHHNDWWLLALKKVLYNSINKFYPLPSP